MQKAIDRWFGKMDDWTSRHPNLAAVMDSGTTLMIVSAAMGVICLTIGLTANQVMITRLQADNRSAYAALARVAPNPALLTSRTYYTVASNNVVIGVRPEAKQ